MAVVTRLTLRDLGCSWQALKDEIDRLTKLRPLVQRAQPILVVPPAWSRRPRGRCWSGW